MLVYIVIFLYFKVSTFLIRKHADSVSDSVQYDTPKKSSIWMLNYCKAGTLVLEKTTLICLSKSV